MATFGLFRLPGYAHKNNKTFKACKLSMNLNKFKLASMAEF